MSFSAEDQDSPRLTPAVQWLIAINIAIYFLQLTLFGDQNTAHALAFERYDLTERPWTIFTYMFVHKGFVHLAVNMYMLFLFGPRVERAWGSGKLAGYYVWCGLGGCFVHAWLVHSGALMGASAAIYGVMLAYAVRWPDEELTLFPLVFISLKVRWLVMLLAAFNLGMGLYVSGSGGGDVAYFAHLGGFASGWLYLWMSSSVPSIDRLRQRMSQVPDVSDETPRAIPRSQPRSRERAQEIDEIVARSNAMSAKRPPSQISLSTKFGKKKADELNLVLDKISRQGLESLTSDERRLLEEMSRELRGSE